VALCLPDYLIDERDEWWNPAWQHMHYLLHRPDVSIRYYNCVDSLVLIDGPARYAFPDAANEDALRQFPIYSQFLAAADRNWVQLPDRLGIIVRADRSTTLLNQRLTEIASTSTVAWAPEAGGGIAQLPVDFGSRAEFLGYTLSAKSLKRGGSFDLSTYWRVTGELPPQLSQFTHVLNAKGEIVTQVDRLMLTSASLRAGDVFAQTHHLTLPGNLKAGQYSLSIGLYTQMDGARLPIAQAGQPRGDRLWLQSITVEK
jgi:hypothetical protein